MKARARTTESGGRTHVASPWSGNTLKYSSKQLGKAKCSIWSQGLPKTLKSVPLGTLMGSRKFDLLAQHIYHEMDLTPVDMHKPVKYASLSSTAMRRALRIIVVDNIEYRERDGYIFSRKHHAWDNER